MDKKLDITNYEESLEILSEEIDFHLPIEDKEAKKAALYSFVDYLCRQ